MPITINVSQFANPSAVVPSSTGFYLFTGDRSGKDGRHQLVLQRAPLPTGGANPVFATQSWTEVQGGQPGPVHKDGSVTRNGVFNNTPAYAMALDDGTIELVYGGAENVGTVLKGGIWAQTFTPETGSGELLRVNDPTRLPGDYGSAWSNSHAYQPSIGVAQVPGEPIYLMAFADGFNKLDFRARALRPWDSPLDPRTYTDSSVSLFNSDLAWTGDVSITVVVNTQAQVGDPAFALLWTMRYRDAKGNCWAQVWMSQLGVDQNGIVTVKGQEMLGQISGDVKALSLHRGVDGVPYLFWTRPSDGLYCCSPVVTKVSGGPDPFTTSQPVIDSGPTVTLKGVSKPPAIFYTFDPMPEGLDGDVTTTPVTRWVQFDQKMFATGSFGKAQRSCGVVPPHQPGQLGQLLGWIQGGPPVPNENIQARDLAANDSFGKVVFGDQEKHTTDWSLKTSVGSVFKAETEAGIPLVATVSLGVDLAIGVTGGLSRETETETLNVVYDSTKGVDDGSGANAVLGDGTALLLYPGFVQYVFTFLDDQGKPNPLAPQVIQLYVEGSDMVALNFQLDPEAETGIIPGELLSYEVDPQTRKALEGAAIAMDVKGNPRGWLTTSVSASGGTREEIGATLAGSASLGAFLDLKTTVGAEAIFDEDKASVSRTLKIDFDYTWKTSSTVQLSCEMDTDAVSKKQEEEGAFSSWTFDTILVQHDVRHTTELLGILKANPTPDNAVLAQRIQPASTPWKITYLLDDYVQPYPPGGGTPQERFLARHPGWQPGQR